MVALFPAAAIGGGLLATTGTGAALGAVAGHVAAGMDSHFVATTEGPGIRRARAVRLVIEVVLTAVFLVVILGVTAKHASPGFAGLSIGLCLTLIHLISIPVTKTSVNPARSTSQAIFAGSDYLSQLWLFWLAPLVGAVLGALLYSYLLDDDAADQPDPAAA